MEQIILYTSDTCTRCKTVKEMLRIHSVDYVEVTDRDYIMSLDIENVPAIKVGDKIIDNYVSVLAWLQKNGYYSLEVNNDEGN